MKKKPKTPTRSKKGVYELQFTRPQCVWPDMEIVELEKDKLKVTVSQVNPDATYKIKELDENGHLKRLVTKDKQEIICVYNPSLDRYYCKYDNMMRPFITPQSMNGFRLFFHEPSKIALWMVPRNGSCTILSSLINAYGGKPKVSQPASAWNVQPPVTVFEDIHDVMLLRVGKWENYKFGMVWQDPMAKAIRHMNYIFGINPQQMSIYFSEEPSKIKDPHTFIDTYLAIAELNSHNARTKYEQHLIPQSFYVKNAPVKPEIVIKLEDLETFIEKEMHIKPIKSNMETSIALPISAITEEHKAWINRIYGDDYKIPETFKSKLYTP